MDSIFKDYSSTTSSSLITANRNETNMLLPTISTNQNLEALNERIKNIDLIENEITDRLNKFDDNFELLKIEIDELQSEVVPEPVVPINLRQSLKVDEDILLILKETIPCQRELANYCHDYLAHSNRRSLYQIRRNMASKSRIKNDQRCKSYPQSNSFGGCDSSLNVSFTTDDSS